MVRLSRLGWTQKDIATLFGVDQSAVSQIMKDSPLGKIHSLLGDTWNDQPIADLSSQLSTPLVDTWSAALDGNNDQERLKLLGIKIQPYDVWNFSSCHDLMGNQHPGRIPGQLIAHVLFVYTKPGDLVVDPMAGSGTTLDACSLMGRKRRGYDIDGRHERYDIEQHDLTSGWPEITSKANLVFWDPPYFDKMDAANIGEDGYIEGSISGMDPDEYLQWFTSRFAELHETGATRLAFLPSSLPDPPPLLPALFEMWRSNHPTTRPHLFPYLTKAMAAKGKDTVEAENVEHDKKNVEQMHAVLARFVEASKPPDLDDAASDFATEWSGKHKRRLKAEELQDLETGISEMVTRYRD
jgi:hypothetical protein